MPPASPGIAVSQKSCVVEKSKPILSRRTTRALTTNQTMNAIMRFAVVIVSVRQAIALPVSSQNVGSSGSHRSSHRPELPRCGSV